MTTRARALRLVPPLEAAPAREPGPRVSLRLLMAASGRCSCDDCLRAYRAGDKRAGIVEPRLAPVRLSAVR